MFWFFGPKACGIILLQPWIKPATPLTPSNHRMTRERPGLVVLSHCFAEQRQITGELYWENLFLGLGSLDEAPSCSPGLGCVRDGAQTSPAAAGWGGFTWRRLTQLPASPKGSFSLGAVLKGWWKIHLSKKQQSALRGDPISSSVPMRRKQLRWALIYGIFYNWAWVMRLFFQLSWTGTMFSHILAFLAMKPPLRYHSSEGHVCWPVLGVCFQGTVNYLDPPFNTPEVTCSSHVCPPWSHLSGPVDLSGVCEFRAERLSPDGASVCLWGWGE